MTRKQTIFNTVAERAMIELTDPKIYFDPVGSLDVFRSLWIPKVDDKYSNTDDSLVLLLRLCFFSFFFYFFLRLWLDLV
jgi:hypothetical protein